MIAVWLISVGGLRWWSGSRTDSVARNRAGAHGPAGTTTGRGSQFRIGWAPGRGYWLIARRSVTDPTEIAYYVCYGPRRSTLADLAWTAGSRWRIKECFAQAKNQAGLDHHRCAPGGPGMPTSPFP